MKALEKHLKTGSGNLRGGDEAAMFSALGAKKGALNLFSLVNDKTKQVNVIIDQVLLNYPTFVGFHPMQNDATTAIATKDIATVLALSNHTFEAFDFS
jgi:Ala-tRNA(Pro) deacylase